MLTLEKAGCAQIKKIQNTQLSRFFFFFMASSFSVSIELSGGCELVFGNKHKFVIDGILPNTTLRQLVIVLRDKYITERQDQFLDPTGTSIRPGILTLVNQCDSEVVGAMDYVLEPNDVIEFVSTLHGG